MMPVDNESENLRQLVRALKAVVTQDAQVAVAHEIAGLDSPEGYQRLIREVVQGGIAREACIEDTARGWRGG